MCRSHFCFPHNRILRLSQPDAKVPNPLMKNLPQLLSGRMSAAPVVRQLFGVVLGQCSLKTSPSKVQIQHVCGTPTVRWQAGDKHLVGPFGRSTPHPHPLSRLPKGPCDNHSGDNRRMSARMPFHDGDIEKDTSRPGVGLHHCFHRPCGDGGKNSGIVQHAVVAAAGHISQSLLLDFSDRWNMTI